MHLKCLHVHMYGVAKLPSYFGYLEVGYLGTHGHFAPSRLTSSTSLYLLDEMNMCTRTAYTRV